MSPPLGTCAACGKKQSEPSLDGYWHHGQSDTWFCSRCFIKKVLEHWEKGNRNAFNHPIYGCEWCASPIKKHLPYNGYECSNPKCSKLRTWSTVPVL